MRYPNQQTLICSCRKCANSYPLSELGVYNDSGATVLFCPSCNLETPPNFGKGIEKFVRFLDRLEAASAAAEKYGFVFKGWRIDNKSMAAIDVFTVYDLNRFSFQHQCGKAFNLSPKQLEAAASTPAKFKCRSCHASVPLAIARELMVCLRHVKRGFGDIQHGFMPDLFACAGQKFASEDYIFPIYQEKKPK